MVHSICYVSDNFPVIVFITMFIPVGDKISLDLEVQILSRIGDNMARESQEKGKGQRKQQRLVHARSFLCWAWVPNTLQA